MTLLELMVAMSLLTVVVLGLYLMFDRVQRAFRSSTTQVDVMEGGRSTVSIIARDLVQMRGVGSDPSDLAAGQTNYNPSKAYINLYVNDDTPELPNLIAHRLFEGTKVTNFYKEILFLTQTNGTWTAIGYRLASRTNFFRPPTNGVGTLVRYELVMTNVESVRVLGSASQNQLNLSPIYRFTTEAARFTNDFQPILDGVVSFDLQVLGADGVELTNGSPTVVVPNTAPINTRLATSSGQSTVMTLVNSSMPGSIEFFMRVLEPPVVDQVRGLPTIHLQTNFLGNLDQVGKVHMFRQRVPIRQGF
jgi:hypothetical protein